MKTIILNTAVVAIFVPLQCVWAIDPVCERILKAGEARSKMPAWQSINEGPGYKGEFLKAEGEYYRRHNSGNWERMEGNVDQAEKEFAEQVRNGTVKLSDCKDDGSETINGVETSIIAYVIEMPGAPSAMSRLFIGKSDGLPYAQRSSNLTTQYHYRDINKPSQLDPKK